MATFTFNGRSSTIVAGTVGFGQGRDGSSNSSSSDASLGVGLTLNGFNFSVSCPDGCDQFQEDDYITAQNITLLFLTKTRVCWSLGGGNCTGNRSFWSRGLGLGISGRLRFNFECMLIC